MATAPRIGFVGFGEAGFHIAAGLRKAGIEEISAFDINSATPGLGEKIRQRAAETGTQLVDSNGVQLADLSDIILSTVTSDQALTAARQTAVGLDSEHLYADLNSVSPSLKQSIDRVITATGARFAEVAVMSPIPPYEHRAPMLIGGAGGADFIKAMKPFGMQMEYTSAKVGEAAATKMCRSIVVKGMEALLTECVLGSSRYGAEERVFKSLAETFPGLNWSEMATYMVGRVVVHGERRAREMEEVAETLRSMGVEPMMAEATVRRMDWSAQLGLKELFRGEAPATHREFADAIAELDRSLATQTEFVDRSGAR
jgi:3-hydroxyisobutyrate dehydrogenase-like beta-hydroxyacid dehydrogenase